MIQIAICDDETTVLSRTKKIIEGFPVPMTVECFTSGEALLAGLMALRERGQRYQVVLLDIDMPGLNGLETAKHIRAVDKQVKLIYITNHSDYSLFAFSVHAFAYLLKPVTAEMLYQQLDEALSYDNSTLEMLRPYQTEHGTVRLPLSDIRYFEYQNRHVILHTASGRYTMRSTIGAVVLEHQELGFAMPHKSFVVNLFAVRAIKGPDVLLTDGSVVPLSQKQAQAFKQALNLYLSAETDRIGALSRNGKQLMMDGMSAVGRRTGP